MENFRWKGFKKTEGRDIFQLDNPEILTGNSNGFKAASFGPVEKDFVTVEIIILLDLKGF